MAHLDRLEKRADADMAALYWWRRDRAAPAESPEPLPLNEQLVALAERMAPALPRVVELPGNCLRAKAAARRAHPGAVPKDAVALDPALLAALRSERRSALVALMIGLIATAAPLAAAIYTAIMQEPVALGVAVAGGCAASLALYHAARWFLLTGADAPPNFLA